MADGYLVGQGRVSLAPRNSTGLTGGYVWVGDVDALSLTASEDYLDFNESHTGARARVVHVPLGMTAGWAASFRRFDATNLARVLHGTVDAAASGTVTGEALMGYANSSVPLARPGVTALTLRAGATTLVAGTDYTLDSRSGMVTFLPGSTAVTGAAGVAMTADYTAAASGGTVQALMGGVQEYSLRYDGFSQTDGSPIIVNMHRVTIDLAGDIALIGTDVAALDVTGAMLPDTTKGAGQSQWYTITRGV